MAQGEKQDHKNADEQDRLWQRERAEMMRRTDQEIAEIRNKLSADELLMTGLEQAVAENTAITRRIETSMAGIVAFSDEISAGTKFFCRMAKAAQFMGNDIIKPMWFPVLVIYLTWYVLTHGLTFPPWALRALEAAL